MQGLPRIAHAELPTPLRELLAPRVERLGYLGEFFQIAGHQPEALGHFVRFTESLKSALPANLTELVALSVSSELGNAYERVQHERLALKQGLSEAWVRDVERLDPDAAGELDALERSVQRLVLSVVRSLGRESSKPAAELLERVDPAIFVGILLATARYLAHAAVCNTIGIEPPVASPLATPF